MGSVFICGGDVSTICGPIDRDHFACSHSNSGSDKSDGNGTDESLSLSRYVTDIQIDRKIDGQTDRQRYR